MILCNSWCFFKEVMFSKIKWKQTFDYYWCSLFKPFLPKSQKEIIVRHEPWGRENSKNRFHSDGRTLGEGLYNSVHQLRLIQIVLIAGSRTSCHGDTRDSTQFPWISPQNWEFWKLNWIAGGVKVWLSLPARRSALGPELGKQTRWQVPVSLLLLFVTASCKLAFAIKGCLIKLCREMRESWRGLSC